MQRLIKILSLLVVMTICLGSGSWSQERSSIKEIKASVMKELSGFLDNIPAGFENQHGFNSRAEFDMAVPGSVYTIMGVNSEGKVFAANLFNVAVMVNDEYRAMITVSFVDGKYKIESVGAALLARELQVIENEVDTGSDLEKIMLNVYHKQSGFVAYQDVNADMETADFIPLASAKTALEETDKAIQSTYKLAGLIDVLIND